jgi:hypothetical protein
LRHEWSAGGGPPEIEAFLRALRCVRTSRTGKIQQARDAVELYYETVQRNPAGPAARTPGAPSVTCDRPSCASVRGLPCTRNRNAGARLRRRRRTCQTGSPGLRARESDDRQADAAALKFCTILLYAEGYRPEKALQHYRTGEP